MYKLLNGGLDCSHLLNLSDFCVPKSTRSQDLFGMPLLYKLNGYQSIIPRLLKCGNDVSPQIDFFGSSLQAFKRRLMSLEDLLLSYKNDCYMFDQCSIYFS